MAFMATGDDERQLAIWHLAFDCSEQTALNHAPY